MRAGFAAAALAAFVIAAPAAAQPSGAEVMRGALEELRRGHGPEVRDYGFTLVHEGVRTPVYVDRGDEEWRVHTPEATPMSGLMSMAVMWPSFVPVDDAPEVTEGVDAARYVREEQVEGRRAHVVTAEFHGDLAAEGVDSAHLFIDAESRRLVRVFAGGTMPEEGGQFAGGKMSLTIDMLDHQETDGVVVPRRLRARMRMEVPEMGLAERAQMTMGIALLRAQMQGSDDPEAREMLAMMEMFSAMLEGGELDIPMTVEDVVVNAGPPAWLEEM